MTTQLRYLRALVAGAAFALLVFNEAAAVPVTPGGPAVVLPGTTVAAQPDLAGTILEDVVTAWDSAIDPMYGFPGATGTLQSRVVRETSTGTLDFYWRLVVSPASYPSYIPTQLTLTGLDLANFLTGASFDANYRLDGLGTSAPADAFSANPGSFTFEMSHTTFGPPSSSYFLLLHSNATDYAANAFATFGVTTVSTFAPVAAIPEPSTYLLMALGLGVTGWVARRRRATSAQTHAAEAVQ